MEKNQQLIVGSAPFVLEKRKKKKTAIHYLPLFYPYYKKYTLSSFETYVSDNPERSTTHNYFLLLLSEQGVTGLAVFIILTIVIFVYAESIYHRVSSKADKHIVLGLGLVMLMVYVNLMLSDMLESDKVGPFFYFSLAMLASIDIRNRLGQSFEADK